MDRDTLDRVIFGSRLAADRDRQHTIKEPGAGQAPPEHFQDKHTLAKARVESGFPSKNTTMLKCWSGFSLRLTRNRSRARIVGDRGKMRRTIFRARRAIALSRTPMKRGRRR
jgi:hypothetical protein